MICCMICQPHKHAQHFTARSRLDSYPQRCLLVQFKQVLENQPINWEKNIWASRTFSGSCRPMRMLWGMGPLQAFGKSFFDRRKSLDSAFKLCRFERLSSQVPGLNPACGHHRHVSESDTSTLPCIQYHVH